MKLLWFIYYHSVINSEKYTPKKKDYYSQAAFELCIGFTVVFSVCVVKTLYSIGAWEWLKINWPYDYGRMHSKNWWAPSGVLAFLCFLISRKVIRAYFLSPDVNKKIFSMFKNKKVGLHVGGYSSVILWVFSAILAVFIGAGAWMLVISCLVVILLLEYWVRKAFT